MGRNCAARARSLTRSAPQEAGKGQGTAAAGGFSTAPSLPVFCASFLMRTRKKPGDTHMQNLIITGPAVAALVAGFFSLGGSDPAAQAAAVSAFQHAPQVAAASAAPAPSGPALFRVRGEWVSVGTKDLVGLGPGESVSPTGQQAGASLAPGLTFTGSAAVALKVHSAPDSPAPLVVALYAAERPGLAFIVAPHISGPVSLVVPDLPQLDFLPVSALPRSCVHRPTA